MRHAPEPAFIFQAPNGHDHVLRFVHRNARGVYWSVSRVGAQEATGYSFIGPLGTRALFDAPHHDQDPLTTYGPAFEGALAAQLANAPRRNPTAELIRWKRVGRTIRIEYIDASDAVKVRGRKTTHGVVLTLGNGRRVKLAARPVLFALRDRRWALLSKRGDKRHTLAGHVDLRTGTVTLDCGTNPPVSKDAKRHILKLLAWASREFREHRGTFPI